MSPPRVVSLIASATEWVAALGAADWLVGRSHECDFPPTVLSLPACSAAKFDVHGDSRQIDDRVKAVLKNATSVYSVNEALLEELQPTVVITQTQCEVCAVSLKDVEAAVCGWATSRPRVVACEPNSLADVWADGRRIAAALNLVQAGERLLASMQQRLDDISTVCRSFGAPAPRVACVEWQEPLMAAGNWIPELVERAGGVSLFGETGKHSPWMTWDALVAADPDLIIAMPCGFDLPRTRSEMHWLTDRPEWANLRAVREKRVYVTDGNAYFNRPGPRLVDSAEMLAEMLYPGRCDYGHFGVGWQPL